MSRIPLSDLKREWHQLTGNTDTPLYHLLGMAKQRFKDSKQQLQYLIIFQHNAIIQADSQMKQSEARGNIAVEFLKRIGERNWLVRKLLGSLMTEIEDFLTNDVSGNRKPPSRPSVEQAIAPALRPAVHVPVERSTPEGKEQSTDDLSQAGSSVQSVPADTP